MRLKYNLVGAGLTVAMTLSPIAVPSVASAADRSSFATSVETSAPSRHNVTLTLTTHAPAPQPAQMPAEASERGIGSIFINAVKKYSASAYKAMVNAVKAGRASFKRWFNTLPAWLKAASGGLGADLLYDIIKNALGL